MNNINTILNEENESFEETISLDELYEEKQNVDAFQIEIYKKVLTRIHKKIKMTAKQKKDNTHSFFVVPEILFGCPKYDTQKCITFIIEKLVNNGFHIKYTHPNLLFISWNHYIPNFQRDEIKRKTGITVDGFGNIVNKKNQPSGNALDMPTLPTTDLLTNTKPIDNKFKDISKYKPSGIYDESMLMNLK
jgi:hypothetical protein